MKLNRLRNLALGLIFLGFLLMYMGVLVSVQWLLPVTLVIGTILILISTFIYLKVGMMSMKIPTVQCPHCEKYTKVMGTEDGCQRCNAPLRLEMDEEGKLYAVENRA